MHILLLSAPPVPDHGWGRYTRELLTALRTLGHDLTLVTSSDAPVQTDLPVAAYERSLPSLIHPKRFNSSRLLRSIPVVRQLAQKADLIHVTAEPYLLAADGFGWATCPVIVTAHGTYVPQLARRPGIGWLYRAALRRSRIICVSRYTEGQVRAALPAAQTSVIPNGVSLSRFQRSVARPEKRGPTVLSVGQIKPRKGVHILTQAMKWVRQAIPDAQAVIIGDTSDAAYLSSLTHQIAADGLIESVHFLGRVSDEVLLGWYQTADLFALPALNIDTKFEGFGLVYLEANAAGLPVVGTRGNGAEEAIRDGETGLLVAQNDPEATADAILALLRDPNRRTTMGEAGRRFAEANSWAAVAGQVSALYQSLR